MSTFDEEMRGKKSAPDQAETQLAALGIERSTRRAPHMERYVEIREHSGGFQVWFQIGPQSFQVGPLMETRHECLFMYDMFCIALDELKKHDLP